MSKAPKNTIKSLTPEQMALLEQSITFDKIKDHVNQDTVDEIEYLHNRPLNADDVAELYMRLNNRMSSYTTTLMRQVSILNYIAQVKLGEEELEDLISKHDKVSQEASEAENKKREEMEDQLYEQIEGLYNNPVSKDKAE